MPQQETLKQKTAKGLMWGGMSTAIQQLLNLAFGIILARRLSQADYGMIGMLAIFSAIAACMQEGGFIAALNRKKEVTQRDYNAVFWTSVFTSIFFYVLFWLCAPLIASFYDEPRLTSLARYSFLSFLFVSFSIAPRAYIFKNMMVRQSSIISMVAVLLSGLVGVAMAYAGYAYWGLATQAIVFTLTVSILNFWFSGWRPSLPIDLRPVGELLGFSSSLILTNILTAANTNLLSVLLGRHYTADEVGDFTQASKWNTMGHSLITGMLYTIAQPVLTKTDDDRERQKHVFRKLLRFTAFVSFPLMLGLSLVSEEFIVLLITDKWLSSAWLLRWLAVAGAVMPVSYLFSNLLISRGRSRAYLWSTAAMLLAQLVAVGLCIPLGISRMVQAFTVINIVWVAVWFVLAKSEIGLRATEALRDVLPYVLLAVAAVAVAYVVTLGIDSLLLSLVVKVLVVAALYPAVLWLFGSTILRESFLFITKKKIE
ncbi:MAG: lipopolysaccharide biosynthesis protein [Prevotella sp.]|nr:lipopolysaccharide biosynthesis protein [Prevotella sp.]